MRHLWVGILAPPIALSIYAVTPVSGQQQQVMPRPYATPPPLVVTAFGGKPITYKAPRTPWGDPDLQGVWSSDDMEGVGIAAGGRGGGRGAAGAPPAAAAAPPAGPPAMYLTDEQLDARRKQVASSADNRDRNSISTFRNDYARRAFPQTRRTRGIGGSVLRVIYGNGNASCRGLASWRFPTRCSRTRASSISTTVRM